MPDIAERLGADWTALTDEQRATVTAATMTSGTYFFNAGKTDDELRRECAAVLAPATEPAAPADPAVLFDAAVKAECVRAWGENWRDKFRGRLMDAYETSAKIVRERQNAGQTAEARVRASLAGKDTLSTADRFAIGTAIETDRQQGRTAPPVTRVEIPVGKGGNALARLAAANLQRSATTGNVASLVQQLTSARRNLPALRLENPVLALKIVDRIADLEKRLERAGVKLP